MTIAAMRDSSPEVDFFSLHHRKNKRIDVEMLDYGYIEKCTDLDELKGILELLRSGKEGRYPHLEKTTEDRILSLLPARERTRIQRMRMGASAGEEQSEREQLATWTADVDALHSKLQKKKSNSATRSAPPVRGTNAPPPVRQDAKKVLICEVENEKPTKKAIPAYDFRAWEKYNVEKALEDLDADEQKALEQAQATREAKEKRDRERRKELASLPSYINVDDLSTAERKVLARVEKEKGNDCFRANENEEAALYYTRSIAFDDTDAVLYSNRAAAHLRLKNFAQAEDDCSRAIYLDSLYCKAWRRRGMTRFRRGKYAEAIADFEHSLELEPENEEVQRLLAKTIAKWKEVDGTVRVDPASNQQSHDTRSAQTLNTDQQVGTTRATMPVKPFTRFEIIEEDDEDDDDQAPMASANGGNHEDEEEEEEERPFRRFEIIED